MALLKLKEISKEYSGKKVLDTVSLKIQSGDMKVVMGPSGCGKNDAFTLSASIRRT